MIPNGEVSTLQRCLGWFLFFAFHSALSFHSKLRMCSGLEELRGSIPGVGGGHLMLGTPSFGCPVLCWATWPTEGRECVTRVAAATLN